MSPPLTVVVVNSISYTGTTWLNLVLGSHPRAFTLGPPDRVYQLLNASSAEQSINACRVHGPSCQFWQDFCSQYTSSENYFVQLAAHAKCDYLIVNNPTPNGAGPELEHPSIVLKPIQMIRDGRAIAASYSRKHPEESFFDGVRNWLTPPLASFPFDTNDSDQLCLRYEDLLSDQLGSIEAIGKFIGLDYDEQTLRFWDSEHHITAGNAGTIMMIKLAQGIDAPTNQNRAYYEDQLRNLQSDPRATFDDKRWMTELSPRDLFVFDHYCGRSNERFGYDRDRFTTEQHHQFSAELKHALSPNDGQLRPFDTSMTANSSIDPTTPLRKQILPSHWAHRGLKLSAIQTRKLALCISVTLVLGAMLIIALAVLLGIFASS